jgi:hypothetical protein
MQTMNNYQRVERVRYTPNVRTPDDINLTNAYVLARSHIYPEGSPFHVSFRCDAFFSRIGCDSLHNYFPSAQLQYGPYGGRPSAAYITIYIDGVRQSPQGLWEKWKFQFDLRARIMYEAGESTQGLRVGQQDMSCFDLALRTWASSLVLRPNNNDGTTGVMRLC